MRQRDREVISYQDEWKLIFLMKQTQQQNNISTGTYNMQCLADLAIIFIHRHKIQCTVMLSKVEFDSPIGNHFGWIQAGTQNSATFRLLERTQNRRVESYRRVESDDLTHRNEAKLSHLLQ